MPKDPTTGRFAGFQSPNYTPVPDELFDELAPDLGEAELRVVLYIIRRTFGFKKDSDSISLSQMVEGIKLRDGRVLDRGTGMSRRGVMKGCAGLVEKGIITVEKRLSDQGDNEINIYRLRYIEENPQTTEVGNVVPYGRERSRLGVGNQVDPQETVIQKTVKQETEYSNIRKVPTPNKKGSNEIGSEQKGSISRVRPANISDIQRQDDIPHRPLSNGETTTNLSTQRDMSSGDRGMVRLGDALLQRRRGRPSADEAEARRVIRQYVEDFGRELGDQAPKSSVTRATNLMQEAGVSLGLFIGALQDAKKTTQKRSGNIQKQGTGGLAQKNKMAYFFSVLEDQLGLRETATADADEGRSRDHQGG